MLLQRAVDGDQRSMEQIYRLTADRVRAFLSRLLSPQDAEDILQEVFLAVWRAGSFDPARASVTTWILSIARNKAYDRLRANKIRGRVFEPLAEHDERDPQLSWLQQRSDMDDRQRLFAALSGLSAPQREALVAIFIHNLSYVELAARTGVSASTLKSRVARSLMSLRRQLQDK